MAIEIVSFPIKNGGSFHSYVAVYQRVYDGDDLFFTFPSVHPRYPGRSGGNIELKCAPVDLTTDELISYRKNDELWKQYMDL